MKHSLIEHPAAWKEEKAGNVDAFIHHLDAETLFYFDRVIKSYKKIPERHDLFSLLIQPDIFEPVVSVMEKWESEVLYVEECLF